MKKYISSGIAVTACVLVGVCLFQISNLRQQIRSLEGNLNVQISGVHNSITGIYANIDNMLSEQENLLISSTWAVGEFDIKSKSAVLQCTVVPKEYHTDDTVAVLICNDTEYPMSLKNGDYTAEVPVPLSGENVVSKVQFKDNGAVHTEILDWRISPRYELLPDMNAYFSGGGSQRLKDGVFIWQRKGEIEIHLTQNESNGSIQSVSLLEYTDGEETARTSIPLNAVQDGELPAEPVMRVGGSPYVPSILYYPLDREFEIPFGSKFELYIEMVDNYGLNYRVPLDDVIVDSDGKVGEYSQHWQTLETKIYDENGVLFWEADKELY